MIAAAVVMLALALALGAVVLASRSRRAASPGPVDVDAFEDTVRRSLYGWRTDNVRCMSVPPPEDKSVITRNSPAAPASLAPDDLSSTATFARPAL